MEQLKDFIKSKIIIDDTALDQIILHFRELTVKKDKLILRQGQIVSEYYFVKSGGLRIYFENKDKNITGWVAVENDFFTDLSSLKSQSPCRFNIQAIEETVLLAIPVHKMNKLYKQFPIWQEFGRKIWEDAFIKVIDGILAYQTLTAEERYLATMQTSGLLHRLSLKDLSSYLGITPNSLSRIRKNIK
jgi:CRP-like cAMP-binding protein